MKPTAESIARAPTWRDAASGVLTCAALGPVCIAGLAAGESARAAGSAATGVRDGIRTTTASAGGLVGDIGDAVAEVAEASAGSVAEISSAMRWAVVAVVSLCFLAICLLIAFVLFRLGVL